MPGRAPGAGRDSEERKSADPGIPAPRCCTFLTLFAGAALGGGIAVGLTALVVVAVVALTVIAAVNGARTVALMLRVLRN